MKVDKDDWSFESEWLTEWSEVKISRVQLFATPWTSPVDCSLPGSSVYGILRARILEWVAIPFSRGSSQPRDRTQVSRIAGGFLTSWATREAQEHWANRGVGAFCTAGEVKERKKFGRKMINSTLDMLNLWLPQDKKMEMFKRCPQPSASFLLKWSSLP